MCSLDPDCLAGEALIGSRSSRSGQGPHNLGECVHEVGEWSYSKRAGCSSASSGPRKLLKPTPTRRKRCCGPRSTRSLSDKAMLVNSSQEEGGEAGVWLRVRILNSLVFSLRTTVRAMRDSLREADQIFSARSRIIGSVSLR